MPEQTVRVPEKIQQLLGFDFGTRRIGMACGQRLTCGTRELKPVSARDGVPDWDQLGRIIAEWQPDAFVVGLPLNMDGSESEMSRRARKFAGRLEGRFHKPAYLQDERLSSFEAKGMVLEQQGHTDFGEHSVDGLAACLILESWMSAHPSGGGDPHESA